MDMVGFILGVVIGGLGLWVYMRERVLRLEAEIDAASTRKVVETVSAPPVKTRTVGDAKRSSNKSSSASAPEPAPESKDNTPASAKKKPDMALKLPEPSSASEASSSEEE